MLTISQVIHAANIAGLQGRRLITVLEGESATSEPYTLVTIPYIQNSVTEKDLRCV